MSNWTIYDIDKKPTTRVSAVYENTALTADDFEQCPFKNEILGNNEVLFVFVSGSYLSEMFDGTSDYDLVVVVKPPVKYKDEKKYFVYKGRHIHWYYRAADEYLAPVSDENQFHAMGVYRCAYLKEEHFLYINPKYPEAKDIFMSNMDLLAKSGLYLYYLYAFGKAYAVIKTKEITERTPLKTLSHALEINTKFLNNRLCDAAFIRKVRRSKYNGGLSKEDTKKFIDMLPIAFDNI